MSGFSMHEGRPRPQLLFVEPDEGPHTWLYYRVWEYHGEQAPDQQLAMTAKDSGQMMWLPLNWVAV